MTRCRQRHARKRGSAEIHPCELMASWIYDEKFLMGMQFLFGRSSFTAAHDDDLNKKSGSRTRSAMHDDDRLQVPSEPQELSDHVSSGGQATSYDRSNRWSDMTTDRDFIDDYPVIWIYDDKIRLLFI
jgi:hypothetical protein